GVSGLTTRLDSFSSTVLQNSGRARLRPGLRPRTARTEPTPLKIAKVISSPMATPGDPGETGMWNDPQLSRRELLSRSGSGFGLLALADLLAAGGATKADDAPSRAANPYAVRPAHHTPRARRCIFLYMPGGPSQVDLFDPKPRLKEKNGQPLP